MNYNNLIFDTIEDSKLRFERKFLILGNEYKITERILLTHSFGFREIYSKRRVHSLYFDTPNFTFFNDNLIGSNHRIKFRLRWYDSPQSDSSPLNLELKIKRGEVAEKLSFKIGEIKKFDYNSTKTLNKLIKERSIPNYIKEIFYTLTPTLTNNYERKYYISADGNLRLTLDFNLSYGKPFSNDFKYQNPYIHLIEAKYSPNHDNKASQILSKFPFRISKNSKYVDGINRIYFHHLGIF
jgi:SPX domain protein involved in polyphosphate accumulation